LPSTYASTIRTIYVILDGEPRFRYVYVDVMKKSKSRDLPESWPGWLCFWTSQEMPRLDYCRRS